MTQPKYSERFPDYGISTKMMPRRGTAQKLLTYANFKGVPFTREDYQKFRVRKDITKDMFNKAMQKLIGFGYIRQTGDAYVITLLGKDAMGRINARDAMYREHRIKYRGTGD